MAHDEFNCDCHETCSWCVVSVRLSTLREADDGALVCADCRRENPQYGTPYRRP